MQRVQPCAFGRHHWLFLSGLDGVPDRRYFSDIRSTVLASALQDRAGRRPAGSVLSLLSHSSRLCDVADLLSIGGAYDNC